MSPWNTWRWTLWALALFSLAMVLLLSEAKAQQPACGPLAGILAKLVRDYQEFVVMTGKSGEWQIFITKSEARGFTIIQAKKNVGCILAAGSHAAFDRGI